MSNPWTPGPWRIEAASAGSKWPIIQGANWSGEVAIVYNDGETSEGANARLIAAAPKMADWIASALRMVDGDGAPPDWDEARAILARIRGETT